MTPDTEAPFPAELRRCTCGTRSFNERDHANGCALGLTPPHSSSPMTRPTYALPEQQRF
jgi:hypothetical protein